MASVTVVLRSLDRIGARWNVIDRRSVWSATSLVVVAWGLMAVSRLGGLTIDAPRAFLRLVLVGVWGWLGLSVAIWLLASVLARHADRPTSVGERISSLQLTLAVAGWAHTLVAILAVVVLFAAGALELLGPGLVLAVVVFGGLLPLALFTGVGHVFRLGLPRCAVAVVAPYVVWYLVVARHLLAQVEHLL